MPGASNDFDLRSPASLTERFAGLANAGHIAVAVSGGSDSMALARLMLDWRDRLGDSAPLITLLTVDHGLRPEARAEAARVGAFAAANGAVHETLHWTGAKPATGLQATARDVRYRLMVDWCRAHAASHLATAHTLDDQAETLVMRLARGSGLDGLAAMAPSLDRDGIALVRPVLDLSRADLRALLVAADIAWDDDPSNDDRRFERVRVRDALAVLEDLGVTRAALARSAARLGTVRSALDEMVHEALAACVSVDVTGRCTIACDGLEGLNREIALRVLARCLRAAGGGEHAPPAVAVDRLAAQVADTAFSAATLGGCAVRREGADLTITRESARITDRALSLDPERPRIWDRRFRVAIRGACADCDIVVRPLTEAGWAQVSGEVGSCARDVRRGLVSFWSHDRVVAVPHLGYRDPELARETRFAADFCNFHLIAGARHIESAVSG